MLILVVSQGGLCHDILNTSSRDDSRFLYHLRVTGLHCNYSSLKQMILEWCNCSCDVERVLDTAGLTS